nr:hypothetical protein [Endozoicomonas sp.]
MERSGLQAQQHHLASATQRDTSQHQASQDGVQYNRFTTRANRDPDRHMGAIKYDRVPGENQPKID